MAINNFPRTGGGGQSNMDYIKSARMSSAAITWNRAGAAGTYAVFSSSGSSGYAYFVGGSTTGVPLNKVVPITHSFTRIEVVGIPNDIINLYKVSVDANTSVYANPSQAYYQWFDNSLLTAKVDIYITGGTYTLPTFAMPIADVQVIAGGGGGHAHAGGAGAGGVATCVLFPISPGTQYTVGAGGGGQSGSAGGNSTFGAITAIGGAPTTSSTSANNGGSGSGAGKSGSNQARSGGLATQTNPSGGRFNHGYGHNGGSVDNSTQHTGAGGGGAGGAGGNASGSSPGKAGDGILSILNGVIYAAGGTGSHHEGNAQGGAGAGAGNYGQGGNSSGNTGFSGLSGAILVRSYG